MAAACAASGCEAAKRVAITPFYKPIALPDSRVLRDIAYVEGPAAHATKHRLDLFLPEGRGWTTVVFMHGGNWIEGDKSLHVSGADIYGNLGRFFASHGYGAAIINYRLIPEVRWEAQPADVARAVKWVHAHIAEHGGNPASIVLMGHSAGAQLASLVGTDRKWLEEAGVPRGAIAGVVAVSGAGYDIADPVTYELFHRDKEWYSRRFHTGGSATWEREASPVNFIDAGDPPFLLMFASGDPPGLRRQSLLLRDALARHGVWHWVVPIANMNHATLIVMLSRLDRAAGPTVLRFLGQLSQHSR
jgi:acetyl esterase/lipase